VFVLLLKYKLDDTVDFAILQEPVKDAEVDNVRTVFERISRAMQWLSQARDERGLSYIAQGDWCDPMNMVGYKGKGVSGWLTEAACYALQLLLPVCRKRGDQPRVARYEAGVAELNGVINQYLWDGDWYARGITDDDVVFGTRKDPEGRIFLNPQSWGLLCGAPNAEQQTRMLTAIAEQLE